MTGELVRYDAMRQAIAAACGVDEVKRIRDQAAALELYARKARDTEAERQCCEIRLRAEREAGKRLERMEKANGARGNPGGRERRDGQTLVYLMFPIDRLKALAREAFRQGQYRKGGGDGGRFDVVVLRLAEILK